MLLSWGHPVLMAVISVVFNLRATTLPAYRISLRRGIDYVVLLVSIWELHDWMVFLPASFILARLWYDLLAETAAPVVTKLLLRIGIVLHVSLLSQLENGIYEMT